MLRFVYFFATIAAILCGVTYFILKRRLHLHSQGKKILGLFLAFIFGLMIYGPIQYRVMKNDPTDPFTYALQFTQYFLMGWVGVIFIVFFVAEVLHSLVRVFDPKKRIFLTQNVTKGLITGVTLSTGIGFLETIRGPDVVPITLTLPGLPESFRGLKIAQISDVHIGPLLHREFLSSVAQKILSEKPDMIFITGDLVDGSVAQLSSHVEPLRLLQAKEGIYFCTGNHEYYSGAQEWIDHLESMGIHVFKNSNRVITRPGQMRGTEEKILVAGVYDFQAEKTIPEHKSNPLLASQTPEKVSTKLLLAHNPFSIDEAAAAGFDLQFSGHTHAGQFYPFAWIARLALKHFEGHYVINPKTQLYVNRGTGYWGAPNRLGKPSEITLYTLNPL